MINTDVAVTVVLAALGSVAYLTLTHHRVSSVAVEVERQRDHTDHVIDALARIETRVMGIQSDVDTLRDDVRRLQQAPIGASPYIIGGTNDARP